MWNNYGRVLLMLYAACDSLCFSLSQLSWINNVVNSKIIGSPILPSNKFKYPFTKHAGNDVDVLTGSLLDKS